MDSRDDFRLPDEAPGAYFPLRADEEYRKTYYPDGLPPSVTLPDSAIEELVGAMHALGRLDGVGSEVSDPGAVFSAFVYKEAEQSSQVEGTNVTVSDIRRLQLNQFDENEEGSPSEKDVKEARNYLRALEEGLEYVRTAGRSRKNVTLELIKSLHGTLMEGGRTEEDDPLPGEFRPDMAYITEGREGQERVRFAPPTADMAAGRMQDLIEYVQDAGRYRDLVDIAIVHYQFETIHPFRDGNGRVGRLLIMLLLYCCDLLLIPLLYPSAYIGRHRDEYTDLLLGVSERGEWEDWIEFFLRAIRIQANEAFVRAKLLLERRAVYRAEYEDAPESVTKVVGTLFANPYLTVTEAAERIGMSYGAANNAVERLVDDGVLEQMNERKKNRVFVAREVMEIIERPPEQLPNPSELIVEESRWTLARESH